ncbi:transcription factor A, mitochondrial-like [Varroa jacobsoni]|uniref:transcription factor A, mitochondrial-like n=1 Tax=Varroa jacobsoni TaxID=62625 RepID=UPI000BF55A46|nr:transcription factor A, mitochondrial-like [Varroa jacobsoni]
MMTMTKLSRFLTEVGEACRLWSTNGGKASLKANEEGMTGQPVRRSRAAINSLQQKSSMISVPKAPKKPPNAYIAFAAAAREGIILKNPGISFTDVAKRLGAEWKGLNTRQREVYMQEAKEAAKKYVSASEAYRSSLTPEQIEAKTKLEIEEKLRQSKRKLAVLEKQLKKPSKPGNVFAFFMKESFSGQMNDKENLRAVADRWKNISDDKKQVYIDKAKEALMRYNHELELWTNKMEESKKYSEKLSVLQGTISELKDQLRNFK